METIVLIGSGGHCKSCIDVIEASSQYSIAGVVVPPDSADVERSSQHYPIVGTDDDLEKIVSVFKHVLIAIGQLGRGSIRASMYEKVFNTGAVLPIIVSTFAHVSRHSAVGGGTIVMHMAMVNSGAAIGTNCIINSMALVEHDVVVGNNVHIATGARVNGNVDIGSNTFIGSGAIVKQGVSIGENTIIGAGQFIQNDIPGNSIVGICDG